MAVMMLVLMVVVVSVVLVFVVLAMVLALVCWCWCVGALVISVGDVGVGCWAVLVPVLSLASPTLVKR